MLFREVPFLERFDKVAEAGFSAVEFHWPPTEALPDVADAVRAAGLKVVLMNVDAGDLSRGERGWASDPDRQERFRENVAAALELARQIVWGPKTLSAAALL
jgi:hydroxypyruvate isomerase